MRKIGLFIFCLCCSIAMQAEGLEVKRFNQWARDYLTVTNNWNGILCTATEGELPPVLSVITSINGKSTKDMSVAQFDMECGRGIDVKLVYLVKENGVNVQKEARVSMLRNSYIPGGFQKITPMEKPNTINMVADMDLDFFNFNTFDFRLEGDDKLTDRSILEAISEVFVRRGMKRSKDNPDLIFTVEKSLQQTTNSVYVPETQQVVNTGYTTAVRRNVFTGKRYVSTSAHNTVVKSGGYTHTGVSATFHLTFTVLKNDSTQSDEMPVVWKLDFNKFASRAIDMLGVTKDEVSYWCSQYPFNNTVFSYQASTVGVIFESEEAYWNGEVAKVLPGTDAYDKGLRDGDKIMKAYTTGSSLFVASFSRKKYFKAGSNKKRFWGAFVFYVVPFPTCRKSFSNSGKDYITQTPNIMSGKPKYKVLSPNGETQKMKAPFRFSNYFYEYIY